MKKKKFTIIIAFAIITLYFVIFLDNNVKFKEFLPSINQQPQDESVIRKQYTIDQSVQNGSICKHGCGEFLIDESKYTTSYPQDGSCYFKDSLRKSWLPDLHSAFVDTTGEYVVFIGLQFSTNKWSSRTFICEFPDGERTFNNPILEDKLSFGWLPQYIIVITCELPKKYKTRLNFQMNFRILPSAQTNIINVESGSENTVAYDNLTVCQTGLKQRHFLSMCTMVKNVDKCIPSWLQYHKYMGVEHVYIYDNAVNESNSSSLITSLREFINSGFVTVVPWRHTKSPSKTYLEIQIAHENDCLWRHRHDSLWMIKTDVDEYIQPMDPKRPKITDYLRDPKLYTLGGIRIQNWFFGRPLKSTTRNGTIIERNLWRSKLPTIPNTGHILRPINVHYFKIHAIKLGSGHKTLDPVSELRMVHYRGDNPRHRSFKLPPFNVKDTTMVEIWKAVLKDKEGLNTTTIPMLLDYEI
ncbi:uncharacterized protein [Antedon mediterranea]|uniref:uncharacterized protein isoform X1 n=1 Tax=Antedon mediterranea TaxID=105859 RepID=UPI003AF7D87B